MRKKRRANESEESRQKRLAQKRENRRKKQESRQKRLASQSKYQKEKKMLINLLNAGKRD